MCREEWGGREYVERSRGGGGGDKGGKGRESTN